MKLVPRGLFPSSLSKPHGPRDFFWFPAARLLIIMILSGLGPGSHMVLPQEQKETNTAVPPSNGVSARRQELAKLIGDRDRLRTSDDRVTLVRTINQIGALHLKLNQPKDSLIDVAEALKLSRQVPNQNLLIETLLLAGRVQLYLQNNRAAEALLNESLALSQRTKEPKAEAQSRTELCSVYFQDSDLPKARDCTEVVLTMWRALSDKRGEAHILTTQGEVYMRQEDSQQAAAALDAAAAIWRELGESTELANTLIDSIFLSMRQGQWQKALGTLNEAQLLVSDKDAEPDLAGQIATSFGEAFEAYGQLDTALAFFREALTHYRDQAHNDIGAIDAGRQAGRVLARLGKFDEAAQEVKQALALADQINSIYIGGLCHEELGKVWLAAGSDQLALQEFLTAIDIYDRTGNRRPWARAQTFLGQTEDALGNMAAAEAAYGKALGVFKEIRDYTNEAALQFGLGKLALRQHKADLAGFHLKRSIELTEELRENASSKELRTSFLASVHDRYESYVEWLMQQHAAQPGKHFDMTAFEFSERGRARSLLDSLKDSQRELRKVANPALLLDEEKLQLEEQGLLDELARLRSESGSPQDLEKVRAELINIQTRRETLEAQIKTTVKFDNLMRSVPLGFDEIRKQVADSETSLLEYSLGDQKSYLWLITASGMTSYELPNKEAIEKSVHKLTGLLAKPRPEPTDEAAVQIAITDVSRMVLGPVADKLSSSRLIIVPDGILQYISFQMLASPTSPDQPLIVRHEIVNEPSASILVLKQREAIERPVAPRLLAALGDPVLPLNYQVKVSESSENNHQSGQRGLDETAETLEPAKLGPLFFARQELNELRSLATPDDATVYSDFSATRENLQNLDLRQYRILHFATHGFLDARQPELSGLVLTLMDRKGQRLNGFVGLADIYNLRAPVDLVVLSACRTGLGKEVRGEGLVGLTRGFMYAGASTVVASLWKVDDEATSELMKRFYSNMLQKGMAPAAALRAAQNSIRQEPQWHSPYYWAAFTLQGDYRHVIVATPKSLSRVYLIIVAGLIVLIGLAGVWWYRRGRTALPS